MKRKKPGPPKMPEAKPAAKQGAPARAAESRQAAPHPATPVEEDALRELETAEGLSYANDEVLVPGTSAAAREKEPVPPPPEERPPPTDYPARADSEAGAEAEEEEE